MSWLLDAPAPSAPATAARRGVKLVTFDGGIAQLLATPTERGQLLSVLH